MARKGPQSRSGSGFAGFRPPQLDQNSSKLALDPVLGLYDGFDAVSVTFDASAGDTPRDRYWAHFDGETGPMERVTPAVTA